MYLIELSVSVTSKKILQKVVELVGELEEAIEQKKEGKETKLQIILHKFDSYRPLLKQQLRRRSCWTPSGHLQRR